jgi:hypothetical protein
MNNPESSPENTPEQQIQLPLTKEQQEMIHRVTGEYVNFLQLAPNAGDASSGTGRGVNFNWRISADSGIPRQQWVQAFKPPTT